MGGVGWVGRENAGGENGGGCERSGREQNGFTEGQSSQSPTAETRSGSQCACQATGWVAT